MAGRLGALRLALLVAAVSSSTAQSPSPTGNAPASVSPTASLTSSVTPSSSITGSTTASSSVTTSVLGSATGTRGASVTATVSSSQSITTTPSITTSVTNTASVSASSSVSVTGTVTVTSTVTVTATVSVTASITASVTASASVSPSTNLTPSSTPTSSVTASGSVTSSRSSTQTPIVSASPSPGAAPGFAVTVAVFNSTGAPVLNYWVAPGTSANVLQQLVVRIYRTSGSIAGCTVPNAGLSISPSTGVTVNDGGLAPGYVLRSSYIEISITLGTSAAAGAYTASFAADSLVCPDGYNVALVAQAAFNVGLLPTSFVFEAVAGPTTLSAPLELTGVPLSTASPFNYLAAAGTYAIKLVAAAVDTTSPVGASITRYIDLPPALQAVSWVCTTPAANTLLWTAASLAGVLPGVYDIGLRSSTLGDAVSPTNYFAFSRIRIVVGMPPVVYNALSGRVSPQSFWANSTTAVYATNATYVGIEHAIGTAAITLLSQLYSAVNPISAGSSGFDVSASLLPGFATAVGSATTANGVFDGYAWAFSALLTEGTYLLPRLSAAPLTDGYAETDVAAGLARSLVLIIDRTPPVASNATWAGASQAVNHAGLFQVPASMFSDAISSTPAAVRVLSVKSVGMDSAHGYYCLVPAPLSGAFCRAAPVTGGPATLVFEVVAEDEAGNQARAYLTVPVAADVLPTLAVADNRGVFVTSTSTTVLDSTGAVTTGTLLTGGGATVVSSSLALTVVLTNADPLTGVTTSTLTWTGMSPASSNVVSSANGRVWTFTYNFATAGYVGATSGTVALSAGGVTRAIDSVASSAAAASLHVIYDSVAPTAVIADAAFIAGVGVPFFAYVPTSIYGSDTVTGGGAGSSVFNIVASAGSTADVLGLSFTAGKLGRAYISGTAGSLPTARTSDTACGPFNGGVFVKFSITLADEAGNTAQQYLCVGVGAMGADVSSLVTARNTISVGESNVATTLDASAVFTYSLGVGSAFGTPTINTITLFLETPDDSEDKATVEALALSSTGGITSPVSVSYAQPFDAVPGVPSSTLVGSISVSSTATDGITAAEATAVLQGATYVNNLPTLTPGYRMVRVVLSRYDGLVVGYTFKTISVSNTNNAPALTATVAAPWKEGWDFYVAGAKLFTGAFTITDLDDTALTAATVSLATVAGVTPSAYGACDPSRDFLALDANYTAPSLLPVPIAGVWAPASCTLTLRPVGTASAPIAAFVSAITAVVYRNGDRFNPTNGYTHLTPARLVSVIVTDASANGKASAPKTSAAVTGVTVPTLVNDPPTVVYERLYGPGGPGYSYNETALVFAPTVAQLAALFPGYPSAILNIRRTPLLTAHYGNGASGVQIANTVTLDLSNPLAATVTGSGSFGNGALVDPDTAAVVTSAASIGIALVDTTDSPTVYSGITLSGATVTSVTAAGVATFTITLDETVSDFYVGPFGVQVSYGSGATGATFTLWFDARAALCIDLYTGAETAFIPDANACNTSDVDFTYNVASVTGNTANAPWGQFVQMPSKSVGNGGSAPFTYVGTVASSVFNFQDANASAAQVRHDLIRAGVPEAEGAAYVAATRAANRGMASFYFERNSFATATGTLAFGYTPVSYAAASTLPAVNTAGGEVLDETLLYELTPAGVTFVFPVTVCLFTGDTPAGYTRALRVVSQLSATDASAGWGAWEAASGVTYDAVTGLLCGNSTHFSVFAPVLVPLAAGATVSKAVTMGGACPNDCSGKGYCRAAGRCLCFAGFYGYDCSLRQCPVAASWDADGNAGHGATPCADRGTCNAATGTCTCLAGFEGAACQRTACPNACSGTGRCVLLADVAVAYGNADAAAAWEAPRLQQCLCDGGYTGPDCSQQVCPHGDDPETTCDATMQVQQITLDYGSIPAGAGGNPALFGLYDTDELSLTFQTPWGQNLSLPRIDDLFDPAGAGAASFAASLKALPNFAVSDVVVTGAVSPSGATVSYNVTFDGSSLSYALTGGATGRLTASGTSDPGAQAMLLCPTNSAGALGCQAAGCRPLYAQARLLDQPSSGVAVTSTAILQQPPPLTASDAAAAGVWGVSVNVIIASQQETGVQAYNVTSLVYNKAVGTAASGAATASLALPATPVPPAGSRLRYSVPLVYGLEVDFDAGAILDGVYTFSWSLPTCSVTQVVAAGAAVELAECSNRGVCDRTGGVCKCFAGYAGANCGMQAIVV